MHLHVSGSDWLSPSAYQMGDERSGRAGILLHARARMSFLLCVCVPTSTCIYPSHMFDFYSSLSCRLSSDANSCSSVASQRLDSLLMFNADATLFCVKPPHPASVEGQVIYTIEDMSLTNRYISFFSPLPTFLKLLPPLERGASGLSRDTSGLEEL